MKFDIQGDEKSQYLQTKTWQEARSIRLRIDDNTCQNCGSRRNIQVHHINRTNNDDPNPYTDLITLCAYCHKRIEDTIKSQTWKTGVMNFSIITAELNDFEGSEKMDACERVAMTLMVSDGDGYLRYIKDYIPLIDSFKWKWRQLSGCIELSRFIDTETICNELIGKQGLAEFSIKSGEYGEFSVVDKYLEKQFINHAENLKLSDLCRSETPTTKKEWHYLSKNEIPSFEGVKDKGCYDKAWTKELMILLEDNTEIESEMFFESEVMFDENTFKQKTRWKCVFPQNAIAWKY